MAYEFWNMRPRTRVSTSYDFPPGNLLGDASPANSPRSMALSSYDSDSSDDWVRIDGSSLEGKIMSLFDWLYLSCRLSIQITVFQQFVTLFY